MKSPGSPPTPTWIRGGLAALMLWTFALRLWHGSIVLDSTRYFDEQFSMRNVAAILVTHELKPSNAFYPSLSYLPQTAVLAVSEGLSRLTGITALSAFGNTGDGFSPTAYLLSRAVSALFASLSLWALFALGKRFFDARAGLLAALFLAVLPPFQFASSIFKPDILVVLLTLVGFGWCVDALLDPSRRRYVVAGVGIGLAVAAKYTGVGLAIPLTAGTLLVPVSVRAALRDRRRWGWLCLAGGVSILTFAVLNPFLLVMLRYLPRLWKIAEGKAAYYQSTPWDVLGREVRFLWVHHGIWIFAFACLGLAGLVQRLRDREAGLEQRLPALAILAYVLGYSALYVAFGKVFRGQNYIPVAAFTALAAAWALITAWDGLARQVRWLRPRPVAALVWGAFAVALLAPPARATYLEVVPSTLDEAERFLVSRLQPVELRQLAYEKTGEPLRAEVGESRMLAFPFTSLTRAPAPELDRADGEVVLDERFASPERAFYEARRHRPGVEEQHFSSRGFASHGPKVVVLLHPWTLAGEPQELAMTPTGPAGHRFQAVLEPPLAAGELVSLSVWLPLERGKKRPDRLFLNGLPQPLYEMRIAGRKVRFLTPRTALPPGTAELAFRFEQALDPAHPPRVMVNRWQPPAAPPVRPPGQ